MIDMWITLKELEAYNKDVNFYDSNNLYEKSGDLLPQKCIFNYKGESVIIADIINEQNKHVLGFALGNEKIRVIAQLTCKIDGQKTTN